MNLLLKPGINANIRYYLDFSEKVSDFPKTQHAAELISYHLKDLRVERIGVDGLPNKPKST